MKLIILSTLLMCIFVTSSALAQPTAEEIATQIETYWKNYQFDELENYINTLYQNYPNYIPAILAKSFYHFVFRNHLTDSLAEVNRVADAIKNNPQLGSKDFRERVNGEKRDLEMSIETHQRKGITQEERTAAISPRAGRDAWGDTPLPQFKLIASAPNESI